MNREGLSLLRPETLREWLAVGSSLRARLLDLPPLDYALFDAQGVLGRMYALFGEGMNEMIAEMNEALTA